MKIAVIGAGAMGALFGGYLSRNNETYLIDTNEALVNRINESGLRIIEEEEDVVVYPKAMTSAENLPQLDLVIIFVKAMYSRNALESNKSMFSENTLVLTLQNGSGHDILLKEFVEEDKILIGTTQDNCAVKELGIIKHGGTGKTYIGSLTDKNQSAVEQICKVFSSSGFQTEYSENIKYLIWDKLFLNTSISVLTGILQVKMGFMLENDNGRWLMERLIGEAVETANADGFNFNCDKVIEKAYLLLGGSKNGITSICSDLYNGRITEVDTISGSVVRVAQANGTKVPTHECMVKLVHSIEQRKEYLYES